MEVVTSTQLDSGLVGKKKKIKKKKRLHKFWQRCSDGM